MDSWTDQIISQMLMAMDSTPVNPTLGQRYLSLLVCKNLTDLGETGSAILADMKVKGLPTTSLPDEGMIQTCQTILKLYYDEAMFPENGDLRFDLIRKFPQDKANTAFRIYRAIRNNILAKPDSGKIQQAVNDRDKKYFLDNFDQLFADVPFKENLTPYKNFLKSPHVPKESQDTVWDFFQALLEIFLEEAGILEDMGIQ